MVYITTYTTRGEEKIWMFLDKLSLGFGVLAKKNIKRSKKIGEKKNSRYFCDVERRFV